MEQIVIKLKDAGKREFLLELLRKLDFIELQLDRAAKNTEDEYDFFRSAGLFEGRSINSDELRTKAWRIQQ